VQFSTGGPVHFSPGTYRGTIAGNTRREIEEKTGKKVVMSRNAKELDEAKDKRK